MYQSLDIENIIEKMTVLEKAQLLAGVDRWHTAAIPRLNIPSIRFTDGPNGVRGTSFFPGIKSACFPCGTSLGATWDKRMLYEVGELLAIEAKHKSAHVILGPTVNIQRSPLGGRGYESYSEDPVLSGLLAAAIINGIQGKGIAACIKHYVCNDIEDERIAININISERAIREIYIKPFMLALKYANPAVLMTSYSKVNGTHVSQSKKLLKELLRDEYGWGGTIISDWYGTYDTKLSIKNGLDIEMPGPPKLRIPFQVSLQIKSKELHVDDLNDRVKNILKLIDYLKDSYIPEGGTEDENNNTTGTANKLRAYSSNGIVLLKNENDVLPLRTSEKIAIIGPNAKNTSAHGGGSAALNAYYTLSPYDCINKRFVYEVDYTVGAYSHKLLPQLGPQMIREDNLQGYSCKVYLDPPSVENRTLIDHFNLSNSYIRLPDYENKQIPQSNIFFMDMEGNFIPDDDDYYEFGLTVVGTAQLFIDGKLIVDNKSNQRRGTSFYNTGTLEEKGTVFLRKGQKYKIKIEFGSGPTSTLLGSTDSLSDAGGAIAFGGCKVIDPEKEIQKAVEIAKQNDKLIVVIGLSGEWESEGYDRPDMRLPGLTYKLVEEVSKVNKNVIVVNQSGTPVDLLFLDNIPALVQHWFGGNEGANALADILFGDVNPSGKLPLTFPKRVQNNPSFLNFKSERGQVTYGEGIFVGYRYYEAVDQEVIFPFGFGLSYTKFDFANLNIEKITDNKIKLSVTLENIGDRDGKEVVQVYVSQQSTTVNRPRKELINFEKVFIKKGQIETVYNDLDLKLATSFWDEYANKWISEAGDYNILVGNSSDNITLCKSFKIMKETFFLGL
ncbi:uncharacterized protein AC631_05777 [Debaryomyces fabryi]|uniref:beta-glucosidase n=1 Tax=Debaryomyces fabryi TaxID=58627 RepID=A0A0V1PQE8_9ASCO|nr:uncharacterized protein AC631_05777 [Debaryomyces fabryi]KRZ98461.1 hypothetical protein AC631_05777 [Debaryomyces fabryi]CUM53015.1 unnamed protein product [Debaryomyces fabryi]